MRLNGVEPSRPVRDTRPSTLRVYQFRHSRVGGRSLVTLECVRGGGYSTNMCSNHPIAGALWLGEEECLWTWI